MLIICYANLAVVKRASRPARQSPIARNIMINLEIQVKFKMRTVKMLVWSATTSYLTADIHFVFDSNQVSDDELITG